MTWFAVTSYTEIGMLKLKFHYWLKDFSIFWHSVNASDRFMIFMANFDISCSGWTLKFMFFCLENIYTRNDSTDLGDTERTKKIIYIPSVKSQFKTTRYLWSQFSSWWKRKFLAFIGPRGDSITTPVECKTWLLVAKFSKLCE